MPVYFVQAGDGGPIKIGFAKDAARRLPGLQVNNPMRLIPLGQIPGCPVIERRLHTQFASFRISGEWFAPNPGLLAVIAGAAPIHQPSEFVRPSSRSWTLDEIIAAAGSVNELARIAQVKHSTISATWRRTGRVPVERAHRISEGLNIRTCPL